MKKNSLLNIALFLCNIAQIVCIINFVVLTGATIYTKTIPDHSSLTNVTKLPPYSQKKQHNSSWGMYSISKKFHTKSQGNMPTDAEAYHPNKSTYFSLFLNILQQSVLIGLIYLSISSFKKIINSVKNISTFQQKNISSLRTIGKYTILYVIISSYTYFGYEQANQYFFHPNTSPLVIALFAYILAEVFKEGNRMAEENKLTV